mmetsp:Transcript_33779/g.104587  ORF Transcript_33779/g.104587 Transcript_33779/m.104587 type:complete len:253 (-) Transcript_33779:11-769(-)
MPQSTPSASPSPRIDATSCRYALRNGASGVMPVPSKSAASKNATSIKATSRVATPADAPDPRMPRKRGTSTCPSTSSAAGIQRRWSAAYLSYASDTVVGTGRTTSVASTGSTWSGRGGAGADACAAFFFFFFFFCGDGTASSASPAPPAPSAPPARFVALVKGWPRPRVATMVLTARPCARGSRYRASVDTRRERRDDVDRASAASGARLWQKLPLALWPAVSRDPGSVALKHECFATARRRERWRGVLSRL